MKFRQGFVSNSGSASFIVSFDNISRLKAGKILEYAKSKQNTDHWRIEADMFSLYGETIMDNDDFEDWAAKELEVLVKETFDWRSDDMWGDDFFNYNKNVYNEYRFKKLIENMKKRLNKEDL